MLRRLALAGALLLAASPAFAAKLYISEYSSVAFANGYQVQVATEPSTDQSPVDFSGGEAKSALFQAGTTYVRVVCDAQCSVKFGTSPTATNSNKVLPALVPEYFSVIPGGTYKISVIANP